jgi:serine/threonine-protein kinase
MSDINRLTAALSDRYAVERELGTGGMATVYLAEDLKHHRKVAVKVLHPELAATLGLERFVREIEIVAKLSHPHILPLYDSGQADGFLYYVMPYVEGETLRQRLVLKGRLSIEETIRATEQIASALSYAHERGVIHRDIKPENIMLAGDQAIVADFGIARAVEVAGGEKLTGTGLALGTPSYMSPEQAIGEEEVDGRSDVYALGCVVYEMVGGRAPFEGVSPQALFAKHAVGTVPSLRMSDPAIPVFLERAVEKALAKKPADRFKTPTEFAQALTTKTVVTPVSAIERLAVLPFTNLMNDPEQEFLVQGMHEAVISELTQAGVTVIARSSVMQYRNTQTRARDIASELGVDALIEGSAFRDGDNVGIQVRMFDGVTEEYLWSQSYDGDLRNVFGLYRGVARAIVDEIQLALTPEAEARLASARPVNPEAYEAYLKGQMHFFKFSERDSETALQYFELAREIDPNYALAYAGIAMVWGGRMQMGLVPSHEALPLAKAAVAKALELDSTLAEVHYTLAVVSTWWDWEWEVAEKAYQRAIALNPNHAGARTFYSHFLAIMRRQEEAMEQIERAVELDPLNSLFQAMYGMVLNYAHQYEAAAEHLRNILTQTPDERTALAALRTTYHLLGMHDEAIEVWRTSFAARGDREAQEVLERGYAEGDYFGTLSMLAEMMVARSRTTHVTPWQIATFYTRAGKNAEALEWLERAHAEHDANMPYISIDPIFDGLRDEPRFQALLHRMGLPQRPVT